MIQLNNIPYRRLGRAGLKVSAVCLGSMQFGWTADEATSFRILDAAFAGGINFIDSANVYSGWADGTQYGDSERIIGKWLKRTTLRRDQVIIASKVRGRMGDGVNNQGLSRHHIMQAVDDSLKRLGTDYIDLYQVHSPDNETPLEETMIALNDLVRSGKVRYLGCSNFPAWLLTKALWISDKLGLARFETVQPRYSLVHRAEFERELMPLCLDQEIGVLPYSPLASGFLTGKYQRDTAMPNSPNAAKVQQRYMHDQGFAALDELRRLGRVHNTPLPRLAIGWVAANPTVSAAIIGANSVAQLNESIQNGLFTPSAEEKKTLDQITAY